MPKVFFINGQRERVAEIFSEEAPREGFELTWLPRRVSDEGETPLDAGGGLPGPPPGPESLGTSCERPRSCA